MDLSLRFAENTSEVRMVRSLVLALTLALLTAGAVAAQEVIDFDDLPAGTIVIEAFSNRGSGPVLVNGINPNLVGNAAVVFDSAAPTGGDDDLGTPNVDFGGPGIGAGGELGAEFPNDTESVHLLILAEDLEDLDADGLIDDPDDADVDGSSLNFDFSALGSVRATAITIIDVEADEDPATVELFDEAGNSLGIVELPQVGNNGKAHVDLGDVRGVASMTVILNGSGAIDEVEFDPECDLELALVEDTVAPGGDLVVDISLVHRGEPTRTPFSMWIENELGDVILEKMTDRRRMETNEVVNHQVAVPIDPTLEAGTYTFVLGTRKMKQGIAWAEKTFTVTE